MRWVRRLLGAICYHCGAEDDLTLDVVKPVRGEGGRHHRSSAPSRASFYWRQLRRENLQVLCGRCNRAKGSGPQVSIPFRPKHLCERRGR